ncbi:hypothetical protein GQ600_23666 [Phytophthora cactorum]|nr:hypothetical protein GQ600_23666 [Phytophthora cactorum]
MKYVQQRELQEEASDPRNFFLYLRKERQTIGGASSSLFSPSPQHGLVNKDEDSDDEDPGDNVDLTPTLSMWGDEVSEDNDIDTG